MTVRSVGKRPRERGGASRAQRNQASADTGGVVSLLSKIGDTLSGAWDAVTGAVGTAVDFVQDTVEAGVDFVQDTVESGVEAVKRTWDKGIHAVADAFGTETPVWLTFAGSDPRRYSYISQLRSDKDRDDDYWDMLQSRRKHEVEQQFEQAEERRVRRHDQQLANLAADGLLQAHTARVTVNNRQKLLENSSVSSHATGQVESIYADRRMREADKAQTDVDTDRESERSAPQTDQGSRSARSGADELAESGRSDRAESVPTPEREPLERMEGSSESNRVLEASSVSAEPTVEVNPAELPVGKDASVSVASLMGSVRKA